MTGEWPPGFTEEGDIPQPEDSVQSTTSDEDAPAPKGDSHARADKLSMKVSATTASSFTPPSDQQARPKNIPYLQSTCVAALRANGSFMMEYKQGPTDDSKALCQALLKKMLPVPRGSLFRDDTFRITCKKLTKSNIAKIVQDIGRLMVPSAEKLATLGQKHLLMLAECVEETWHNAVPLDGKRPQPDYAVGFQPEAFTAGQLAKLEPLLGEYVYGEQSLFLATDFLFFPFLTCEVNNTGLEVPERQNAYSMTLAVRGIVELFRLVGRQSELHRRVVAFSVSHDHSTVSIFGHYPVIEGKTTKYYRHPITSFYFTAAAGKKKWVPYRFTRNLYDTWMPKHLERIRSVLDQLPAGLDFGLLSIELPKVWKTPPRSDEDADVEAEMATLPVWDSPVFEALPTSEQPLPLQAGDRSPVPRDGAALPGGLPAVPRRRYRSSRKRPAVVEVDTTVVEDYTAVFEDDSAVLEDDNAGLEDDNAGLEDDNAVLEDDNAEFEDDTAVPKDNSTVPKDSSTMPKNSSTVPGNRPAGPRIRGPLSGPKIRFPLSGQRPTSFENPPTVSLPAKKGKKGQAKK